MKKIASFTVNHDKLKKGMYVSRIDGDVVTYDIRMKTPNAGDYLTNGAMHTFEHLFATYARNSAYSDAVIYVGPMGCRTGFYFLLRGSNGSFRFRRTVITILLLREDRIMPAAVYLPERYISMEKSHLKKWKRFPSNMRMTGTI